MSQFATRRVEHARAHTNDALAAFDAVLGAARASYAAGDITSDQLITAFHDACATAADRVAHAQSFSVVA